MTDASKLIKSLLVYAICLPLALVLGYIIANPMDLTGLGMIGLILLLLAVPLLLRFHHVLLVFFWNANVVVFFLPGRARFWLVAVALSLLVSVTQKALSHRFRFISVPTLTRPLVFLALVALATAKLRGGIGVRSMGGDVYGGQKLFYLLAGVLGYFALMGRRIPPERAVLYVALFFLSGITYLMGDIFALAPSLFSFLSLLMPSGNSANVLRSEIVRLGGLSVTGGACYSYMLAKYGVHDIFLSGCWWRKILFLLAVLVTLGGGFRGALVSFVLTFSLLFYMEGLHRTRLLPAFLLIFALIAPLALVFADHLPMAVQRTLSVVPNLPVDPAARLNAEGSSEWRLNLWKAVMPQIPQYLLLGKGFAFSAQDFDFAKNQMEGTARAFSADQEGLALSEDYHNGPLSVIIPLGIWGVIAVLWLLAAGCRVLCRNYRYGEPRLKTVNAFLLAAFISKTIFFLFVFGAVCGDIATWAGFLGLSVCLNGGVCEPSAAVPAAASRLGAPIALHQPRPAIGRPA